MFKISYNRAVLRFRLETVTPLSIRAGETGLDPTGSDLVCVRTHHRAHGSTVYIPGSSLKGVIRSAAEASLRSKRFTHIGGGRIEGACDPADHRNSCAKHSSRGDNNPDTARIHSENCAACRLFGSLSIRGRCAIRDLFPFAVASEISEDDRSNLARANQVEVRNGVFISRISGSVAVGPFDQEMIPAGIQFHGEVALQNYQVWQLGLLSSAFGELSDGFVQLGSSKTRGLGVVRVEFQSLIHEQRAGAERRPLGVGDLVDDGTRRAYGLFAERPLPPGEGTPRGLSRRFVADGPAETENWTTAGLGALSDLLLVAQGGE